MPAPAQISSDTYISTTNQSSWDQAHTILIGADQYNVCLLVCIHVLDTQDSNSFLNATTVRLGGASGDLFTKIVEGEAQGNSRTIYTGWFYLLLDDNPDSVTNTSIYWANSTQNATRQIMSVTLLKDVTTTSPIAASAAGNGGGVVSSLEAAIVGTSANSLTFYGWTNRNGSADVSVTGATYLQDTTSGSDSTTDMVATTALEAGATGVQTATATWGGSERASFAAFQILGIPGSTYDESVSDTAELGDAPSRIAHFFPGIADGLEINDATPERTAVISAVTSDGVGVGGTSPTRIATFPVTTSDETTLGEEILRAFLATRMASDGLLAGDAPSGTTSALKTVSDGILAGETVSRQAVLVSSLAQALGLSDSPLAALNTASSLSDGVSLSEAISRAIITAKTVEEAISIADTASPTTTFNVTLNDQTDLASVIVGDVVGDVGGEIFNGSVADAIALAATSSRLMIAPTTIEEAVDLADTVLFLLSSYGLVLEWAALSDETSSVNEAVGLALGAISISESLSLENVLLGVIGDSITLDDLAATDNLLFGIVDEGVYVSDNGTVIGTFLANANEQIGFADLLSAILTFGVAITDGLRLGDVTFYPASGGKMFMEIKLIETGLTATIDQPEFQSVIDKAGAQISTNPATFRFVINKPGTTVDME